MTQNNFEDIQTSKPKSKIIHNDIKYKIEHKPKFTIINTVYFKLSVH
jgi:hypothetical protein